MRQEITNEIERLRKLDDGSLAPTIELLLKLRSFTNNPEVEIDFDNLESRGGHGEHVAMATVTRSDGKIQRFWFKLRLSKNGKSVNAEVVACRLGLNQDAKKSVTGSWFLPRNS